MKVTKDDEGRYNLSLTPQEAYRFYNFVEYASRESMKWEAVYFEDLPPMTLSDAYGVRDVRRLVTGLQDVGVQEEYCD